MANKNFQNSVRLHAQSKKKWKKLRPVLFDHGTSVTLNLTVFNGKIISRRKEGRYLKIVFINLSDSLENCLCGQEVRSLCVCTALKCILDITFYLYSIIHPVQYIIAVRQGRPHIIGSFHNDYIIHNVYLPTTTSHPPMSIVFGREIWLVGNIAGPSNQYDRQQLKLN